MLAGLYAVLIYTGNLYKKAETISGQYQKNIAAYRNAEGPH